MTKTELADWQQTLKSRNTNTDSSMTQTGTAQYTNRAQPTNCTRLADAVVPTNGRPSTATAASWCWAEAEEETHGLRFSKNRPMGTWWTLWKWHWGLYLQRTENCQRQCRSSLDSSVACPKLTSKTVLHTVAMTFFKQATHGLSAWQHCQRPCKAKIVTSSKTTVLFISNIHAAEHHSKDKDRSAYLLHEEKTFVKKAVQISPMQSAGDLLCNVQDTDDQLLPQEIHSVSWCGGWQRPCELKSPNVT